MTADAGLIGLIGEGFAKIRLFLHVSDRLGLAGADSGEACPSA